MQQVESLDIRGDLSFPPDVHTQIQAASMKILALSAREVVNVLEQCSNALLSQVFLISMFNEAL